MEIPLNKLHEHVGKDLADMTKALVAAKVESEALVDYHAERIKECDIKIEKIIDEINQTLKSQENNTGE